MFLRAFVFSSLAVPLQRSCASPILMPHGKEHRKYQQSSDRIFLITTSSPASSIKRLRISAYNQQSARAKTKVWNAKSDVLQKNSLILHLPVDFTNRVIMHYSFKKTVYMDGDGRKNSYPSVVIENSEKYGSFFLDEINHLSLDSVSYTHLTLPTTPYV